MTWRVTRCGCEKCQARRIENPPRGAGCPCRECQPGPGILYTESSLTKNLGQLVRVQQRDYCANCKNIVTVSAQRAGAGTGWVCVCENQHTWTSFD